MQDCLKNNDISNYYLFVFNRFGWKPSEFYNMSRNERVTVEAFIEKIIEDETDQKRQYESKLNSMKR